MNQTITLTANNYSIPPVVYGVYKDTGRDLVASFSDFTLEEGDTAKMYVSRTDGVIANQDGTVNTTNQTVTVALDKALLSCGQNEATIEITRGGDVISSFRFIVACKSSARYDTYTGPAGSIDITENGSYDVTPYESATVNVSGGGGGNIATFKVHIMDWLFRWAEFDQFYAFEEGMTFADFAESAFNPMILEDPPNVYKAFENQNNGDVYFYLSNGSSSQVESAYISDADTQITAGGTYYIEFGSQCLVAGTKIKTERSSKNVENIKVGDTVVSIDPETLELTTATVEKVRNAYIPHERMYSDKWFRYKFSDGSEFHITGRHRFFDVDTHKYEWAEDIKIGDRCYKVDGTMPKLVSVEQIDERVEYNTFWNKGRAAYFVDGFLSGNASTPIPRIEG